MNDGDTTFPWRTEPEIDPTRQAYLQARLTTPVDIKQGIYPFREVKLTRADIEWLLIHCEGSIDLRGADIRYVDLQRLPLTRIWGGLTKEEWVNSSLEQRMMAGVHFERANLSEAHLEGALLRGAFLQGATMRGTYLQGTTLFQAHLEGAYLRMAHLEEANLIGVHFEGAYLRKASLAGADLRNAFFDSATNIERVSLIDSKGRSALLADVHWGDVNLSTINWRQIKKLGDEVQIEQLRPSERKKDTLRERQFYINLHHDVVRANRQVANILRAQGMNEEAVAFAYRTQLLQRKVYGLQILWGETETTGSDTLQKSFRGRTLVLRQRIRSIGSYSFSWFLDILAGYGYKPGRSLFIYLLMILGFAIAYALLGSLTPREAVIFSITSFHGRGFLPGTFPLSSPVTAFAAVEAVAGLFIEISFIATFTQRFFGR